MKKIFVLFIVISFLSSFPAWSQPKLEASLEMNSVSIGNPVYLYVTFYGARDVERPRTPKIDGLQVQYVGPTTKMQVVNGKISQSITYTYLLMPLKAGEFDLGPFSIMYQGQLYETEIITLTANTAPSPVTGPSVTPSAPFGGRAPSSAITPDISDRVFLTMDIDKTTVYVNEVLPLIIRVYVGDMGLRDIEFPTFSHDGFSTGEFVQPEKRTEVRQGVRYNVLVFRQELYAIKEGDHVLGPTKLNCKVVTRKATSRRSSFFGRSVFNDDFFTSRSGYDVYPIELESKEIPVKILPFPSKGRPVDFQGAVGDFSMEAFVDPPKVKVGDPTVLRISIGGTGNLDTVTAPRVEVGNDFKTYEPQVTKKGNRKVYEQILIPKTTKVKEIPKVKLSFFNPRTAKYEVIEKGPFPLEVTEQPESERGVKMVSMTGMEKILFPEEKLGKDIIHIKEDMGRLRGQGRFLYNSWFFWAGQAVPLVLFGIFYSAYRKRERILTDRTYARSLKAPRKARVGLAKAKAYLVKGEATPFYDAIFKTLQEYLGNRFDLPRGSVTFSIIEERLLPAGCDTDILEMLKDVFSRCEMARYASSVPTSEEGEEVMKKVRKVIDYLEKVRI